MSIAVITGGTRSGKSAYAEKLVNQGGYQSTAYIATAHVNDDEMRERVARHRARRPRHWKTLEAPLDICGAVGMCGEIGVEAVLLESMGSWLSNWLIDQNVDFDNLDRPGRAALEQRAVCACEQLEEALSRCRCDVYIVTEEVGFSLVSPYPIGRVFADTLGTVNQRLAAIAHQVWMVVSGLPLALK